MAHNKVDRGVGGVTEGTMGRKNILTIEKQAELETYDEPTITYCISTDRDETFRIRLREHIPDWCLPADFDFHPWYDADDWEIKDGTVIFEQRIEPDDELFTLFSVCIDENGNLDSLVERPSVEVAPVEADAEGTDTDWVEVSDERVNFHVADEEVRTDSAKALASDGGGFPLLINENPDSPSTERSDNEVPETESTSPDNLETAVPTVSESEANEGERTATTNETAATENGDTSNGNQLHPEGSIVDDLVTALQQENVSEEQIQTLREIVGSDSVGSMNARVEHCQTRLSDLAAYTDALEEFLDEEGTGQQLIREFQSDLEAVEDHLEALESEVAQTADGQDDLRERVGEVERDVSALREIGDTVESLEARLDDTTASLQEDLDELRTAIEDLKDWQENIVGAFVDTELVEDA